MKKVDVIDEYEDLLNLLKASLWGLDYNPTKKIDYKKIYRQCMAHAIIAMPAKHIQFLHDIDKSLYEKWEKDIFLIIYRYQVVNKVQNEIVELLQSHGVRFVILKGSSASCYYINPSLRVMGDIDIMPCRKDFYRAARILEEICIKKQTNEVESERHIEYVYKNVLVELHRRFASFSDPDKAQYLDDLILENISENTILSDEINGLVLLQHINQHLEVGVGLRQIIDWMYYTYCYLDDEKWNAYFSKLADNLGLGTLAITVTKICKVYFGMNKHITWCDMADDSLCRELLQYILQSGNFGINRKTNADATSNVFIKYKNPMDMLKEFQKEGYKKWNAVKKYKILKPFAWLYEAIQFIKLAIRRKMSSHNFLDGYIDSRSRRKLMRKLGARDISSGTAKHIDGKMINDKKSRVV